MLTHMLTVRSAGGLDVSYDATGEGAETVVFMHGWAGSRTYFASTIEHLDTERLRAVAVDLPGHGDSAPAERYTLDELADAVIAVADACDADRFVLVGFSMSAKFAQYVSSAHPQRVTAQILVAGCPAGELPLPPELLADWYARAGSAEGMIEIVELYATQPVPDDVLAAFGRDAARVPLAALRGTMELVTSTSFADRLESMTVPTLVVGGLHDPIFAPEALRDGVVAPLRQARLELLDCGHEIPGERPRELAGLIDEFTRQTAGTAHVASGARRS
jgi:pimeloyl-ACP methyl ester carboxylesterase